MTTEVSVSFKSSEISSIKAALESLHNPEVYNQALIDSRSALNLSKATLENHFHQWLWLSEGEDYKNGVDKAYAIQLGVVEEALVLKGLIYNG